MTNVATVFKAEIARIARREAKSGTGLLKKASSVHRADIASLKRRVAELERLVRQATRTKKPVAPSAEADDAEKPTTRFSARSMITQRKRLGLSAADCGLLIGASSQSIYNWEEGKARPRAQHLKAIFALRQLGQSQAQEIVAARKSTS